jgi:hypothetical protein
MCTQIVRAHNNEIEEFLQENVRGCAVYPWPFRRHFFMTVKVHINIIDYMGHILVYA